MYAPFRFGDFFNTPAQNSAAPQAMGFEGFFKGSFSYHFHNFWSVHRIALVSSGLMVVLGGNLLTPSDIGRILDLGLLRANG